MTVFVLVAAALCVLAAALLTRSLWWRGGVASKPLEDEPAVAAPGSSAGLIGVLAVFVFVMAGGGYAVLGAPDRLVLGPESSAKADASPDAQPPMSAASRAEAMAKINVLVDKLLTHLKEQPDDADGWQMLARTYAAMGKQADANQAFNTAEKLRPNDATLLSDHAVAVALSNNRKLEGEPTQLIERALKADPKHPKALALAGTAAFERKDYKGAVRYWEDLAKVEPADSPFAEQIRASIAEARQMASMPAAADAAPKAAATAAGPAQITGIVTLAENLKGRVSPDDTVFVFARPVEGSRMPLAIIRKQVKDLPFQFTLDDSSAMSPASKLSGAASVAVGARVSKSGNAMPQNGDLQGLVPSVQVGTNALKVEINAEVSR
ncbi:MAG: c-type cytochrome biogenesis protein CcmI [Burkholderiales bacterium]|nr:c-type cytochrome biogenesis protein CcmI [Burkholderiales bacterium]